MRLFPKGRPSGLLRRAGGVLAGAILGLSGVIPAMAQPSHGLAMYGEPALPADFSHLPYANPDAPKGGVYVTGNTGGFDSLNPYLVRGNVPWQLRFLTNDTLVYRSQDEPFTVYGLIAESIETGPNRDWVEFTLREEARFSDGSPITVEDVMWSYETLGTEGNARYLGLWGMIEKMEQTGPRKIRFTFNSEDRELALIVGMRPILKKAQWEGIDFDQPGFDVIPVSSSPYVVESWQAGRNVVLKRDPDYWAKDLPIRRGTANFDEIRIEFFGDQNVLFEAFKAGEISFVREFNAEKWDRDYDFPAMRSGEVVKSEISSERPSGITGLVMNSRRTPFDDIRVRDALLHAFNFEYINEALTGGKQPRITSYFSHSVLGMRDGPAEGRVRELLAPFTDVLAPGALEGYALPVSDGSTRNRANIVKAADLLNEAGWTAGDDGMRRNTAGEPLTFEILLRQGDQQTQAIVDIYLDALTRLGIDARVSVADNAQYTSRIETFDFDMTDIRRQVSLSPGNEQRLYWGVESADQNGSRNLMGVKNPAIDAMVDAMLASRGSDDFTAAVRALDRILTAGRYVIPIFMYDKARVAHDAALKYPDEIPIYGDSVNWLPEVWWMDPEG